MLPVCACSSSAVAGGKGSKAGAVKEVLDPVLEAEMAEAEKAYKVIAMKTPLRRAASTPPPVPIVLCRSVYI